MLLLLLLPLTLGNRQDLGRWRPVRGPGEVISEARKLLVIDGNLLDDAGIHACATACVSSEGACRRTLHSPMLPHLQRDSSDSGSGTVTCVGDTGESAAAGSKYSCSIDLQTPPAYNRVMHCATEVQGAAKVTVPEKPCNVGGLDTS